MEMLLSLNSNRVPLNREKIINEESHVCSKKLAGTSACTGWCRAAQEKLLIMQNHLALKFDSLTPTTPAFLSAERVTFPGSMTLRFECRTGAPNPNQEGPAMSRLTYFFIGKV